MTSAKLGAEQQKQLGALRKLLHAAFHVLDDSETNAQTEVISIDNEIAANDLKEMSEALDELGIDCHEDIESYFTSRLEVGHPARLYTAPDCEWEQSQTRMGLMFVLASEHDTLRNSFASLSAMNEKLVEVLHEVQTALPVLATVLRKAAELTKGNHDMGASRADQMLETVRRVLRPHQTGDFVVSGVHAHAVDNREQRVLDAALLAPSRGGQS